MNAHELISQAEGLGITLRIVGDKLRVKARLGIITPEIKAELKIHKAEIMEALSVRVSPATRIYRVIVETDGVHKSMAVIDPSGDDMEAFTQACYRRFGASRVISIESR